MQPLKDIHLKSGFIKYDSHNLNKGSISSVRIFFLISILVLSVSLINYINLNTISSVKRFKEIGLRKVLGSDKLEIRKHYFSESILNTFIAYLLAILLIFIFLPSINNLFSFEISIMDFFQIDFLIFSALLILCASILSSFYQSIYLGKLNPMSILKGSNIRSAKTSLFQKILLVLQYSIALFMISFSYYVFTQMNYIQNVDLGYSNDNVIELNISNKNIRSNLNSLKNELVRNPHIKHVSASLYANKALNNTYFSEKGSKSKVHMYYNSIDSSFLKTLNIELLQGRNIKEIKHTTEFTDVVINESAVKSFGWDDAIGKTIHPNYRVVGVVSNYCFLPLNESGYAPMLFFYLPNQFNKLLIKTDGKNEESTIAFIKAKWREVMNNEPLNLKKLDSYFLDDYQREVKLKKLFVILTIIAITLTLSGLIVLTINSINNKKKEIVIRRVHGASSMQVIKLIYQEILILLIISLTIALPFAVLFIEKWLANFAFRIQLDAFVFITICIVLFVIATFTIAFQLYLASKIDPVKVLKYE
ncbi:MAG: hypothetical protein CL663_01260 [Bacteroidetes bacterium]|nr:hypothetical protein [Bacteroidota bacterium]